MYPERRPFRDVPEEELREMSIEAVVKGNKITVNQIYAELGYRK